jgi:predicted PurR-regulated permease PerM
MLLSYAQTGLVWYYFNILAMAGIIYMLLKIALARAERATLNQSESKTRDDNFIIRIAVFAALFGLVFFFMRQYISEFKDFWEWLINGIRELINE